MGTTTITMTDGNALLRLMTWMSPGFPVGAYTYSHGIEWVVESGDIKDGDGLTAWIGDLLESGSGRSDAVLCALAMQVDADLMELAELGLALSPTEERLLETEAQGQAFIRAVKSGWPDLVPDLPKGTVLPYPVAVGSVAAASGIPARQALAAYLHAFAANIISAGVRLVPLGQSDGVRALATLEPAVDKLALWACGATMDDLWSFSPLSDIASMKHETQYTRLFRS